MAAQMGHPRFDPHGDPIPTAGGEILPPAGPAADRAATRTCWARSSTSKTSPRRSTPSWWPKGCTRGCGSGSTNRRRERIRFEADAEEHVLAPSSPPTSRCRLAAGRRDGRALRATLRPASWARGAEVVSISRSARPRAPPHARPRADPRHRVSAEMRSPAVTRPAIASAAPSSRCAVSRPTRSRSSDRVEPNREPSRRTAPPARPTTSPTWSSSAWTWRTGTTSWPWPATRTPARAPSSTP